MDLPSQVSINNNKLKLDFKLNCKNKNVIYILVCRECDTNDGYYIGRTMAELHDRMNNHRSHFKIRNSDYKNSACSFHIFEKHPENFTKRLENFKLGILKSTSPMKLERSEDYYIWRLRADLIGLNRNKPIK